MERVLGCGPRLVANNHFVHRALSVCRGGGDAASHGYLEVVAHPSYNLLGSAKNIDSRAQTVVLLISPELLTMERDRKGQGALLKQQGNAPCGCQRRRLPLLTSAAACTSADAGRGSSFLPPTRPPSIDAQVPHKTSKSSKIIDNIESL